MDFKKLKSDLESQSYTEVQLSLPRSATEQAVRDFFIFLTLPEEQKKSFSLVIKLNEQDRGVDLGYWRRNVASGFGYDNKEFFHYNPQAAESFMPSAPQELKTFLQSADIVYRAAFDSMSKIVRALDEGFPGLYDKFFPPNQTPSCLVRFLKYDQALQGDFLARGHYDKGSCTLALAESAPGLRIGTNEHDLKEVTHHDGSAFFFTGLSLGEHIQNEIKPSWHDVIQKDTDAYSQDVARWAVVFFANVPGPMYLTREEVHTPKY